MNMSASAVGRVRMDEGEKTEERLLGGNESEERVATVHTSDDRCCADGKHLQAMALLAATLGRGRMDDGLR